MLDLHWSDGGEWGQNIGQHVMPDRNSLAFWKDVASVYKDHPAVIFDLYNEPHNVTWDVWQHGGKVSEKGKDGQKRDFEAVGMQAMLDTVRATGAKNVVIVGGLDWAYDLSGFLEGYRLDDRGGHGIVYANHSYPFKGDYRRALARQDGGGHEDAARDRQRVRPPGHEGRALAAPGASGPGRSPGGTGPPGTCTRRPALA